MDDSNAHFFKESEYIYVCILLKNDYFCLDICLAVYQITALFTCSEQFRISLGIGF